MFPPSYFFCLFFHDTAPTDIYTLSLHDALPILLFPVEPDVPERGGAEIPHAVLLARAHHVIVRLLLLQHAGRLRGGDRKSTRLNSSHLGISYAVFCLKKKNKNKALA